MSLTPKQEKKLAKLANYMEKGPLAVFEDMQDVFEELDKVKEQTLNILNVTTAAIGGLKEELKKKLELDLQIDPAKLKGDKGDNYVLTEADKEEIASKVKPNITIQPAEVTGKDVVDKVNDLPIEPQYQIKAEHISGLQDLLKEIRVMGANRALYQLLDMNISGLLTDQSIKWDGQQWVNYTPVSGPPSLVSGDVNGTNTTFVFASAPTILSIDGVPRQKTQSDGTVNWTGTTTITLSVAPTFDIFALA